MAQPESAGAVVVVGPGRMGVGIAQAAAIAGRPVELLDLKPRSGAESAAALAAARSEVEAGIAMLASIGWIAGSGREAADRVAYRDVREAERVLAGAGVVFEAVPETDEAKEAAYAHLRSLLPARTLVGSTTSTFDVNALASRLDDPSRFMNTHWLNPAPLIPLVEVMPAGATDEQAVDEMTGLLRALGKVPVRCAASAGYIVPRIQALAMNEAARIVEEGVADAEAVDTACRLGFGVRFATMGMLEFVDWGGADILLYASTYLASALGSDRYAPPAIVAEAVARGAIGAKTGRGFHDHAGRDPEEYRLEMLRRLAELLRHLGFSGPTAG